MTTLEATMICLDNSEFMRNGDFPPSRWEVQKETVNLLVRAKLDSNQEAQVGVLSMAGKRTQVHLSPKRSPGEVNKVMTKDVELVGTSNVITAIKTAQLVLKNRQNKNLKQRVVVFVGSPIHEDEKNFSDLGARLNKLGITIDVISFGKENEGNNTKLQALVNATNGDGDKALDTSHFVHVPVGGGEFINIVRSSSILGAAGAGAGGGGMVGMGGSGFGGSGAQDADDELQMVLRMSMEEEFQRQRAAAGGSGEGTAAGTAGGSATAMVDEGEEEEDEEDEDDAELQAAIALSMQMNQDTPSSSTGTGQGEATKEAKEEGTAMEDEQQEDILQDEEFLQQLIEDSGNTDMTLNDLLDDDEDEEDK